MTEQRTCVKCGNDVPKTDAWAEIDPHTNKTVYVCDGCYTVQQNTREHELVRVHFAERCTTLRIMTLPNVGYIFECTYHMFNHVQRETDACEFGITWISDMFIEMLSQHANMNTYATETFMDCDIVNQ